MDTRLNEWAKLKFVDPSKALPKLEEIQQLVAQSNLPCNVKDLRTNKLKRHREGWEACIFCYGIGQMLNTTVYVAPYELSDYDVISMWIQDNEQHFRPIQIKEVVPEKLNPNTCLNQEIKKLERYPTSNETAVVIHINRNGKLNLNDVVIPRLNIAELWLLGATVPDQSKWFIAGNLIEGQNSIYDFDYPK